MKGSTGLVIAALAALLLLPAAAFAHGGGTDGCGGHHDHNRGGYHVHDYSTYCGCHPGYAVCKNYLKAGEKEGATDGEPDTADDAPDGAGKHLDEKTLDETER